MPPTYHPYSKGTIVFKFALGVATGVVIAPVARPYVSKKLRDLDLKLRVMAAEARDQEHFNQSGS